MQIRSEMEQSWSNAPKLKVSIDKLHIFKKKSKKLDNDCNKYKHSFCTWKSNQMRF
jgi:hypothetical protein